MAKQIKFPLIMKNGIEVRSIEELRENYDMVSVIEYFTTGKLKRWLESNYYDDILEKIQDLTGEDDDFTKRLAEALGVPVGGTSFDSKDIIRQTRLKEELKRYVNEKELEDMEYIAESQQDLERFIDLGYKKIYLHGKKFMLPRRMKNTECIGINTPVVSIEAESREEFRNQNIKLQNIEFADNEVRKIAINEPVLDEYLEMLNVVTTYIGKLQKEMGGNNGGKDKI